MDVDRGDMSSSDRTDERVCLRRMDVAAWSAEYVVVLTRARLLADAASANRQEYSTHGPPCQTCPLGIRARAGRWRTLGREFWFGSAVVESVRCPRGNGTQVPLAWITRGGVMRHSPIEPGEALVHQ